MKNLTGSRLWLVSVSVILVVGVAFHFVRMLLSGNPEWPIGLGALLIAIFIATYMWLNAGKKR
jgi:protein-S-isoprenylcysteine O-methyltransferase Ste14